MKFVTFSGERTLTELTRRLFDIKDPENAELIKKVEAELVRANPVLRDFGNLAEGTLLAVPDVSGVELLQRRPSTPVTAQLDSQLRAALESVRAALERSAESQIEEAKATLDLAKDTELKRLVEQMPELKEQLAQSLDDAKQSLKDIETARKAQAEELAQLQKGIEEFMK